MATAAALPALPADDLRRARLHGVLRIATAITLTYVAGEALGLFPSFLAPLLAGVILASLPKALPLKAGIAIIAAMSLSAYFAYVLTSMMLQTPSILFGVIGVIVFYCFGMLARGKAQLPLTLLLISVAAIPVVTLVAPQQAAAMPKGFTQGIMLAVVAVWTVHAIWPLTLPAAPAQPATTGQPPLRLALAGLVIVLPIMLTYLMLGITDALPVLMTTIILVINFDTRRSKMQGLAMMIGNFFGGILALTTYFLLQIAPALGTLAMLLFIISAIFATQIEKGGSIGAVALLTLNQTLVIFGLAIAQGTSNSGLWVSRLFQFGLACTFAVAMMALILPRPASSSSMK